LPTRRAPKDAASQSLCWAARPLPPHQEGDKGVKRVLFERHRVGKSSPITGGADTFEFALTPAYDGKLKIDFDEAAYFVRVNWQRE
jgi:hypothetical protein